MKHRKIDSPYRPLLAIPRVMVFDVLLFAAASLGDSLLLPAATGTGHAAPALTILAFLAIGGITALVVVLALLRTLLALIRSKSSAPDPLE